MASLIARTPLLPTPFPAGKPAAHPEVFAALGAGAVTESYARAIDPPPCADHCHEVGQAGGDVGVAAVSGSGKRTARRCSVAAHEQDAVPGVMTGRGVVRDSGQLAAFVVCCPVPRQVRARSTMACPNLLA